LKSILRDEPNKGRATGSYTKYRNAAGGSIQGGNRTISCAGHGQEGNTRKCIKIEDMYYYRDD
jgi:hypothetical protein